MNYGKTNNPSLKYQRVTSSGCEIKGLENLSLWQKLNSFFLKKRLRKFNSVLYSKSILSSCLYQVDSNMKLGEWAGLCKIDQEGNARKVVKCSCAVVRNWGQETPAHDVLQVGS